MEFLLKNDELMPISSDKPSYLTDNIKGDVYHDTYLDYLHIGYAKHYGIIVKPDFIWFTILNEMSRIIKANPGEYREIFTDSDDKKKISVMTGDPVVMPIESLLESVFELIPSGLSMGDIVLNFSTTTASSQLAFSTSFLEAASPYYTYGMYMCGYNKINVLGTVEDYNLMKGALVDLSTTFLGKGILAYFDKVLVLLECITTRFNDVDFWTDIFSVTRCGSGSQQVVGGWFQELFYEHKGVKMPQTYPKHTSIIEYKNLSTGSSYKMKVGIFSSILDDGYLIPDFEFGVNELIHD